MDIGKDEYLIHTFVTPEGDWRQGLYIGSMLDSIFKFGGKHEHAALKLFMLQPWSSTSMSHLVNIGFGVSAVERMCTVLPLVNTTHSMISWLPTFMSQSPIS